MNIASGPQDQSRHCPGSCTPGTPGVCGPHGMLTHTDSSEFDLTAIPDASLLDMVRLILSEPGPLTPHQRWELDLINEEFRRRELPERNGRRREQYAVRRLRQRLEIAIRNGG